MSETSSAIFAPRPAVLDRFRSRNYTAIVALARFFSRLSGFEADGVKAGVEIVDDPLVEAVGRCRLLRRSGASAYSASPQRAIKQTGS